MGEGGGRSKRDDETVTAKADGGWRGEERRWISFIFSCFLGALSMLEMLLAVLYVLEC